MAATPNTYQDELNKESLNPFSSAQITQMAPPELWIPAEREPPISKDADLNAWLLNQAAALRNSRLNIDWEGIAEELEAMARKDHTSLHSHLQNLLSHLLKWAYEPNHRSISWHKTIDESRDRIEDLLEESPSLNAKLQDAFDSPKVYARAVRDAKRDTGGKIDFPDQVPWSLREVLSQDFLPDSSN